MDPVLQLHHTLQLLLDRDDASPEEIGDAAVLATEVLGRELVQRVRESTAHDALVLMSEALLEARTTAARARKATALVPILNGAGESLAIVLEDCTLGPKAYEALGALANTRVRQLELHKCRLKPPDLDTLFALPVMARIERLGLRNNQLGDDGAARLAKTESLPALRALDLAYARITEDGLARLAAAPTLANLRGLRLGTDKHGARLGTILSTAASLANLRGLQLYGNKLGNAGFDALVRDPVYRSLRRLIVFECGIGESAFAALAATTALPELEEVRFRYDPITSKALRSLVDSAANLPKLRRLQISQCRIDGNGLRALCDGDLALEYLNLGTNPRMGADALSVIGASRSLRGLRRLVLDGVKGGDTQLARLAGSDWLPQLESLSIQNTDITDEGIAHLVRWPGFRRLRALSVGTNELSDASVEQLASVDGRLDSLECYQTRITREACSARLPGVRIEDGLAWRDFPAWMD